MKLKYLPILLFSLFNAQAKKGDIFIAIEPPPAIKNDIAAVQQRLALLWTSPTTTFHQQFDLHITLQFIGNIQDNRDAHYISPQQLKQVIEAMKDGAQWLTYNDPTFRLTREKIGNAQFVVWPSHAVFVIPPSQTLTQVVRAIRASLKTRQVPYNYQRMDFPDRSHMSIAHVAQGTKQPSSTFALSAYAFPVRRIVLKESVYLPGQRYKTIASQKI